MGGLMIGWFVAGMCLGQAHEERKRRDEERRARPPRPVLAWTVFAVFAVSFLVINPATAPVVVGVGIGTWIHERRRAEEHARWKSQQARAELPSIAELARRARAYDAAGMPASAEAMRSLRDAARPS